MPTDSIPTTTPVHIPVALHTELKIWCAQNQTPMQTATARAIAMFLATNGRDA